MNREIQELREVITKLVPLLAGKGLKVTQRGTQAYVEACPKTNKPLRVNIPSIPDSASPEFISAVAGFVDHEVAHVLFTDWKWYGGDGIKLDKFSPEGRALMNMHNIIEDTMIERLIVEVFPGSVYNLDKLHHHFLEKITGPAVKAAGSNEQQVFSYLIVPMMRALSGQTIFKEFMDKNGYWKLPMVENLHLAMSNEALEMIQKARTTKQTLEVAQEVHDILFMQKQREEEEQKKKEEEKRKQQQKQEQQKQKGKSKDKPEQEAGEGDGEGERKHEEKKEEEGKGKASGNAEGEADEESKDEAEGKGKGKSKPKDEEKQKDDEAEHGAGAGDEAEEAKSDDEPETGSDGGESDDQEGGDDQDGDEKSEGSDAGDESGDEAGQGSEQGDEEDGDDGESATSGVNEEEGEEEYADHAGNETGGDDEKTGPSEGNDGSSAGGESGKSMFDLDPSEFEPLDLASAIAEEIQQMAQKSVSSSDYAVFTKDEDRIETFRVNDHYMQDEWVPQMDSRVMSLIGPMQKEVERIMAAQTFAVRTSGHRSGKLHAPSLFRVTQGDGRVFARKEEHKAKDTAVMLLVDNSGSMSGAKMATAMQSAYALATTLERVNIANEVIGFTTGALTPAARNQYAAEAQKGLRYHRVSTIIMPIYKEFGERVTPTVKRRIAYQINRQEGLMNNTDGESLEYAALRLLPRREKRKVMLVLSDGQPVGSGSGWHLRDTVQKLEKIGVETVGIGINSNAVENFYPRHLVLNNVADLPGAVMGELKRILSK